MRGHVQDPWCRDDALLCLKLGHSKPCTLGRARVVHRLLLYPAACLLSVWMTPLPAEPEDQERPVVNGGRDRCFIVRCTTAKSDRRNVHRLTIPLGLAFFALLGNGKPEPPRELYIGAEAGSTLPFHRRGHAV